jgi:hypothetical protein
MDVVLMKFLKGLGLAILGFLLFLSLSIFGLVLTLNQTILNPDFVVSQVDRLNIPSLAKEMLSQQISQLEVPAPYEPYVAEVMDDTIADLEPWIKEQARDGIYSFYDYLEGRSQSLSLTVSLEPVKESLRDNLREAVLQSPPPELAGLPPAEIERYFNEYYEQISQEIPSTFEFTEASLDPQVMAQLEQAKQVVGYLHLTYNALIGLILLLILGIVLINRKVKGSTRGLGTTFLTCGALSYAGVLVAKNVAGTQLTQLDIPVYLQAWTPQFLSDFLAPLEMYGIGLMAAGVALLVVSFVYKRGEPSP